MIQRIIKGAELMLFDNSGHSYAYATSHVLTLTGEATDISSKDHGMWAASDINKFSWEITSENLFTEVGFNALFDLWVAGNPITIRFGIKSEDDKTKSVADGDYDYWTSKDDGYYQGKVLITSLVANANNGENATYSITLTGTGKFTRIEDED